MVNKITGQSSGLSLVVPFVSFGCSSRSCLPPFHRHFTAQKIRQPKNRQPYFSAVRSSSSHSLFLRSVGLMHPQYRFISLQLFVRLTLHFIPLKALSFLSLHSSRILSAALSVFSGCSFAQPSGLAPFRKKLHFALNQGTPKADLYIFPAVSRFYPFSPLRKGYVLFSV